MSADGTQNPTFLTGTGVISSLFAINETDTQTLFFSSTSSGKFQMYTPEVDMTPQDILDPLNGVSSISYYGKCSAFSALFGSF